MKKLKKILIVLFLVIVAAFAGSIIYMAIPIKNIDENALVSNENVTVTVDDGNIFFDGKGDDTLFIYYPGGRVDYTSYSQMMKTIAAEGIDCVIVKMPINFALLGINKAGDIIENSNYEHYYGGGHSLGGVALSMYLEEHPEQFDGLIFTASYPYNDISSLNTKVLSIRGSLDGLVTEERTEQSKAQLPLDTEYIIIEGGNHAQYGTYGAQSGDNEATISNEEQIALTAQYIVDFIEK